MATASEVPKATQRAVYRELATAAESGWDFSSRWGARSNHGLTTLHTTRVLPADLNAMLCGMEHDLARFASTLGHADDAARFTTLARARAAAVQKMMWDDDAGVALACSPLYLS